VAENQEAKWLVVFPLYNVDLNEAMTTDLLVGPCSEAEMEQYVLSLQEDERRLLSVLRQFGWDAEDDGFVDDERSPNPMTREGFIPGVPSIIAVSDLVQVPGVDVRRALLDGGQVPTGEAAPPAAS
jgi:hypothetical protein